MILHDIKIACRNIINNGTYSGINLFGLSIGMGCCFLIMLYVQHELSYDNFHEKEEEIYRVTYTNTSTSLARCPPPVAAALRSDISGIRQAARMFERSASIEIREQQEEINAFNEERFYFVDPEIFEILSFDFVQGSPTDLTEPYALALNEEMAAKYFGEQDPINKTLYIDGSTPFTVKAIVKDFPSNSHLHFNLLSNFETMYRMEGENARENLEKNWVASHSLTFVLLDHGRDPAEIDAQIDKMLDDHVQDSFRNVISFTLQPLRQIHLDGDILLNPEPTGNRTYIFLFTAIAFIIILIACINFINLAVANSLKRVKEVGLRKVIGATKNQLVRRFMAESFIICLVAFCISIILIQLGIPFLNDFTDRSLVFEDALTVPFIVSLSLVFLATAFIAGSYPAFVASSFEPAGILKGKTGTGTHKTGFLNQGLMLFQFTASILLISGSLLIYSQLRFLQDKNLGFDKELIITVPVYNQNFNNVFRGITPEIRERMNAFEESLKANPKIKASTLSFEVPGRGAVTNVAVTEDYTLEDNMFTAFLSVDYDFIDTYGLKVIEGRGFSLDTGTDHLDAMIINESAARNFGWEPAEAIGKSFHLFKSGTIIGVVEDFHFSSLRDNIEPLGMAVIPSMFNYFSIKVEDGQLPSTLEFIQAKWEEFFPAKVFEYAFLDEELDRLYRADQNLGQLINVFAVFAVVISCLGLFGLVSFSIANRAKEIGIRKVLGASTPSIGYLISADFLKLVILSNVFALPLGYYLMQRWLEQFNHRIELFDYSWLFLLAGACIIFLALLTINSKAIAAANTNPVNVLSRE